MSEYVLEMLTDIQELEQDRERLEWLFKYNPAVDWDDLLIEDREHLDKFRADNAKL